MTGNGGYRVRRPLTNDEIQDIATAIDRSRSTVELLDSALRGVFGAVLSGTGVRLDDFGPTRPLRPGEYAIPKSQHEALMNAATSRADEWGTSIQVALDLASMLPAWYDDPSVPTPDIPIQDRRPPSHRIEISRGAVDIIADCERHLRALGEYYGHGSEFYQTAQGSWHRHLAGLFSMSLGVDTRVTADGDRSLLVRAGSGYTYAIIWRARRRRCTVAGCGVIIGDDGTIRPSTEGSTTVAHRHEPSYPLDAPHPGEWTHHS